MFTTSIRGGKAFAAEQKIRELKTRVVKLNIQKLKILPTKIMLKSAASMNNVLREEYELSPKEIETRSLSDLGRDLIFIEQRKLDKYLKD